MSTPIKPSPVLFFCAILYRSDLLEVRDWEVEFSRQLFRGQNFFPIEQNFSLFNYYEKEMGSKNLLRRLWVFSEELAAREDLPKLKVNSNKLESKFKNNHHTLGRVVNFDPGFISLEQVVLATGKPYSHRIYMQDGIYAELTYQYQKGIWCELPWTYPDYKETAVKNIFDNQRALLKSLLK